MKIIKDSKYKLLVRKIKKIEEVIVSDNPTEEDVYESVVDFILVFEHAVKKILHTKNKLLIYKFDLDIDKVNVILQNKKNTLFTIEVREALSRYLKIFPNSKLGKQGKSIEILISNRNQVEHSIDVKNMQTKEELLGILNSVFPIFLSESKKVFGVLPPVRPPAKVKKEENYTEGDIQKIYDSIVLSKISNYKNDNIFVPGYPDNIFLNGNVNHNFNSYSLNSESCPRCGGFYLSKKDQNPFVVWQRSLKDSPELYICSNCKLELTSLEYEAVQRLKKEGKISNSGLLF